MKVKVTQSCLTLCDPMDYMVHGILQARILEWVDFPFSRGIFPTQELNKGLLHCRQILYQLSHKGSPRILDWVAYPFSSESSQTRNWMNWGLLHCRWILYQLSYQRNPLNLYSAVGQLHLNKTRKKFFNLKNGSSINYNKCIPINARY